MTQILQYLSYAGLEGDTFMSSESVKDLEIMSKELSAVK